MTALHNSDTFLVLVVPFHVTAVLLSLMAVVSTKTRGKLPIGVIDLHNIIFATLVCRIITHKDTGSFCLMF